MKKEILNIGKTLTKQELQTINGSSGGCGHPSYTACMSAGCYLNNICVQYHCNRQSSGWFCIDPGNSE